MTEEKIRKNSKITAKEVSVKWCKSKSVEEGKYFTRRIGRKFMEKKSKENRGRGKSTWQKIRDKTQSFLLPFAQ